MAEPFLINGSGGAQDKLGVIAAEQVWEVDDEKQCVAYSPKHSLGIPILDRTWREQPHGKWWLTLKFEGVTDVSAADGNEDYEGDSGAAEDPIETHWNIARLKDKEKGFPYTSEGGRIIWAEEMTDPADKSKTVPNPLFGYEAYRVPQPTWTQHKLYKDLPEDLYKGLSEWVGTPPGPIKKFNDPDGRPRTWLLDRVVPRKRGNIWVVSRTWARSGPGGWNTHIYNPPNVP